MTIEMYEMLKQMLVAVCWLLPMQTVGTCLVIRITLMSVRLVVALVVRIKSFIPTMGA